MISNPHVKSCDLPDASQLAARIGSDDFVDCYSAPSTLSPRQAAEIVADFPRWARLLVRLRALITAPFGLLQEGPPSDDMIGPFPVESETETEIIVGFDDAHLDFRVSVMSAEGRVSVGTWVHRNTLGGRLYLALIMPFHVMVARNAVARVAAHKPA